MHVLHTSLYGVLSSEVIDIVTILLDILEKNLRIVIRSTDCKRAACAAIRTIGHTGKGDRLCCELREVLPLKVAESAVQRVD